MSEQQSGNQISMLAGKLTEFQRHFGEMSTDDRQWVIQNTGAAIGLFVDAVKNRIAKAVDTLFEFIETRMLPAIGKFVIAEKLRVGETVDGIMVGWIGDNIKNHFLGKKEKAVKAAEVRESKLLKAKRDPAIIAELGGDEKAEITFGQFWEFLKTVDRSLWYVSYIRDTNDVLWAVDASWSSGGLYIGADSVDFPGSWRPGSRFVSR